MDGDFRKALEEALRDLARHNGDVEATLSRFPEHATRLRPHLEIAASLAQTMAADPSTVAQVRGRGRLLSAVAEVNQIGSRGIIFRGIPGPIAAAVALLAIVTLGGTGASALGGGILDGVGISGGSEEDASAALDSATPPAVEPGGAGAIDQHDAEPPDTDASGLGSFADDSDESDSDDDNAGGEDAGDSSGDGDHDPDSDGDSGDDASSEDSDGDEEGSGVDGQSDLSGDSDEDSSDSSGSGGDPDGDD